MTDAPTVRHDVVIVGERGRARAVCCCGWRSPAVTAGPPAWDLPPRPASSVSAAVRRVADRHLRAVYGGAT